MVLGRNVKALWFDIITLVLEAINYAFFLIVVEGMSFTIRTSSRYRFCLGPDGSHLHSAECNAIYATLAFAGVDLLLSFVAGIGVTVGIQWALWNKWRNRGNNEPVQALRSSESEFRGV